MHGPEDTITALATPPGEGALAVIRISGPRSLESLRWLAGDAAFEPEPRRLHFLELRDGEEILDQVMAAWLPGPGSYTGEDSVEIYAHGGALAARGILSALERRGLCPAEAGEFSYRAFLNGKFDTASGPVSGRGALALVITVPTCLTFGVIAMAIVSRVV